MITAAAESANQYTICAEDANKVTNVWPKNPKNTLIRHYEHICCKYSPAMAALIPLASGVDFVSKYKWDQELHFDEYCLISIKLEQFLPYRKTLHWVIERLQEYSQINDEPSAVLKKNTTDQNDNKELGRLFYQVIKDRGIHYLEPAYGSVSNILQSQSFSKKIDFLAQNFRLPLDQFAKTSFLELVKDTEAAAFTEAVKRVHDIFCSKMPEYASNETAYPTINDLQGCLTRNGQEVQHRHNLSVYFQSLIERFSHISVTIIAKAMGIDFLQLYSNAKELEAARMRLLEKNLETYGKTLCWLIDRVRCNNGNDVSGLNLVNEKGLWSLQCAEFFHIITAQNVYKLLGLPIISCELRAQLESSSAVPMSLQEMTESWDLSRCDLIEASCFMNKTKCVHEIFSEHLPQFFITPTCFPQNEELTNIANRMVSRELLSEYYQKLSSTYSSNTVFIAASSCNIDFVKKFKLCQTLSDHECQLIEDQLQHIEPYASTVHWLIHDDFIKPLRRDHILELYAHLLEAAVNPESRQAKRHAFFCHIIKTCNVQELLNVSEVSPMLQLLSNSDTSEISLDTLAATAQSSLLTATEVQNLITYSKSTYKIFSKYLPQFIQSNTYLPTTFDLVHILKNLVPKTSDDILSAQEKFAKLNIN